VAGLSPACGHSDAGHELSDLAGVAATPEPRKSGSPTRPFFPLGRIAGVVRCPRCIGRERGGCATKQCSGGCPLNGSWNSTHSGSNKVVLGSKVAVCWPWPVFRLPVRVQVPLVPLLGSYSSAVAVTKPLLSKPPATSTLPSGS